MKRFSILALGLMILATSVCTARQEFTKPATSKDLSKVALTKYDIAVTDLVADDGCFLKVKFENRGNAEIHTTLPIRILVNGRTVKKQNIQFDHLAAGGWYTHTFSEYNSPIIINGSKTVKATVGTVPAWKENLRNNTLEKVVNCQPNYDIAVTDIAVDSDCVLWVKFENLGRTRIHTRLHFKLWINKKLVRDEDMLFDNFESGNWRKHYFTGTNRIQLNKPVTVKAFVDSANILSETNELNNTLEKKTGCRVSRLPFRKE